MKAALLVGVDPGITSAVAILDSFGNLLNVYSKRDMKRGELIKHITQFGKPIVIATDVKIAPRLVNWVARKFGCKVYTPENSLNFDEKTNLTKGYAQQIKNSHELDALAASIKAWKYFRTVLEKIDNSLKRFDKQEAFTEVAIKILKEESPNIEEAVREIIREEIKSKSAEIEKPKETKEYEELVKKLQAKLSERQNQIEMLNQQIELLNRALNETRYKLKSLRKEVFRPAENVELEQLKKANELLLKFRKIENRGYYPILEIGELGAGKLEIINKTFNLEDRIVLTDSLEQLGLLNSFNVKCAIVNSIPNESIMEKLEFPVILFRENIIETIDNFKVIRKDLLEKELASAKKVGFVEWLKGYKKRKE